MEFDDFDCDYQWDAPVDYTAPYVEADDGRCKRCGGTAYDRKRRPCLACHAGYTDVEYEGPTEHPPGSPKRLAVYAARSAAGLDLWNPEDTGAR